MSEDHRPPLRRAWLLLPILIWGLLTVLTLILMQFPTGPQLFLGEHWFPWSWLLTPVAAGLMSSLALWLRRFDGKRRIGFRVALLASAGIVALVIAGLAWMRHTLPSEGSRRERIALSSESGSLVNVDLGQGLRLVYSPFIPVDAQGRTLPHQAIRPEVGMGDQDVPAPITEQSLANLVSFSMAYGHLRWFHPTDAATTADWDRLAIAGLADMAKAQNAKELRDRLQSFFAPVAPRARFLIGGQEPEPLALPEGTQGMVRWVHEGAYSISRNIHPAKGPVRATRLGSVVVTWNLLHHFSPYPEEVAAPWKSALARSLRSVAEASTEADFLHAFRAFTSIHRDAHIWPRARNFDPRGHSLPFTIRIAEGRAFVDRVAKNQDPRLTPGCEILSVDGKSASDRIHDIASEVSASNPGHVRRGCELMFPGQATDGDATVRWRTPEGVVVESSLVPLKEPLTPRGSSKQLREIQPGLWYIDVTRPIATPRETMRALEQAKAVIVDLRGHPADGFLEMFLMPRLIDGPVRFQPLAIPIADRPDRTSWVWKELSRPVIVPRGRRLTARVAFLMDGEAMSYAESLLSLVEHHHLGDLVGEPTAGSNGNAADISLSGGISFRWTGMRALRHDGTGFHRIGVRPTVTVVPTVHGIQAGRDEVLEQALATLAGK
ncbi:MAG TPA: S41 family peptidase [Holophaga sp.]|nr:S41 family peptidase [Holophaga sp.]